MNVLKTESKFSNCISVFIHCINNNDCKILGLEDMMCCVIKK